jgi:hydroxymethylpyrimidine pyrophosphatase-like HAD family hydrolase
MEAHALIYDVSAWTFRESSATAHRFALRCAATCWTNAPVESIPAIFEQGQRFFNERVYITQSLSTFVEYMRSDATKGKGLKKLARRWGISKEEILVAGDHFNDLTMFEEAGFSIAPQNAQAQVQNAASCVCPSNAEDLSGLPFVVGMKAGTLALIPAR